MKRLQRIEMFRAGVMNDGREVDTALIDSIADGTAKAMNEGFVPKVKTGAKHATAEVRGIVTKVYRVGDSLYGDVEVCDDVVEGIKTREIIDDRSVEIAYRFYLKDKTVLPAVLAGIVFGIDVPANHALEPVFENLLTAEAAGANWAYEYYSRFDLEGLTGGSAADRLNIARALVSKAGILAPDSNYLARHFDVLEAAFARMDGAVKTLQDRNAFLESELALRESRDAENFVRGLVDSGGALPASKDSILKMYHTLAGSMSRAESEKLLRETFARERTLHTSASVATVLESGGAAEEHIDPTNHSGGNE